jgi:hypothetical protein
VAVELLTTGGFCGIVSSSLTVKKDLRKALEQSFSTEELAVLCADVEEALRARGIHLQVNLATVGGETKPVQILNLIEYLDRRGHLDELVRAVQVSRPGLIQSQRTTSPDAGAAAPAQAPHAIVRQVQLMIAGTVCLMAVVLVAGICVMVWAKTVGPMFLNLSVIPLVCMVALAWRVAPRTATSS